MVLFASAELGSGFSEDDVVSSLTAKQVHQITALLRVAKFKAPSADCLSPAGEYNLRLGIMKVHTTTIVLLFVCLFVLLLHSFTLQQK